MRTFRIKSGESINIVPKKFQDMKQNSIRKRVKPREMFIAKAEKNSIDAYMKKLTAAANREN